MDNNQELTLHDVLVILYKRKLAILVLVILGVTAGFSWAFFTPEIFRAECRILPPSQSGGMGAAILSQMGGLASLAGLPVTSTGEMLIGILRSQTVVDRIIDQFNLMEIYKQDYRLKMREKVISDILQASENTRSGIVTVAVLDEEPIRAAQMANAFVEELTNVMQYLAIGEAAQRRLFFEQQMLQARKVMDEAEDELQKYQEESGLVAMDPQVAAMVSSIADLRAQVAAKEVELSSLRTYASDSNPNLRRAESELIALQGELEKLEQESTDGNVPIISLRETLVRHINIRVKMHVNNFIFI